ncbi:Cupredoxin-like domain-containing protein [Fodinibius sediminis]|uniref:Cupredoxin-like domain-containing protein n=2 Tax=Fodinibius sediminis TaxID=1214077 RepID=A0A521ERW7_9BACT|nr:plastocyanin/azurin family copper-binding protein [Fodinibius sediminis]SMO86674.1 Cupredoxin-like domain-containing protein [Fodinibius sediminis]
MRSSIISILLCLVIVLCVNCNSKQSNSETHIVEIRQMKFVPAKIEVAPGDSVKWINRDIVAHNVAEETDNLWKSTELQNGDTYTIEIKGKASYLCTIHPVMKGKVILKK